MNTNKKQPDTQTRKQRAAERQLERQRKEWEEMQRPVTGSARMLRQIKQSFRILYNNKKAFVGFVLLMVFLLMATVGPLVVPLDMTVRYDERYLPISFTHPLGTDYGGRDTFAQVVHGSRNVLTVAFLAAVFTIAMGFIFGALAGFIGGWVDIIISFIAKIIMTLPQVPVFMVIAVRVNISNPFLFGFLISAFGWAGLAMAIRAQILSLKERDFMLANQIMGMGRGYVIFKEILPNITSYLAINFVMSMYNAILMSVGLMLLGIIPLDTANWGAMIQMAKESNAGFLNPKGFINLFSPIVVMALFQMACIFFSNGIDEMINPRLRET